MRKEVFEFSGFGGMKDVECHLIPGARHIVLDERKIGAAEEALRIIGGWVNQKTIHLRD